MEERMTIKEIESKIENLKIRFSKMKKQDKQRGIDDEDVFLKFEKISKFNSTEMKMAEYYRLLRQEAVVKVAQRVKKEKQILSLLKSFKLVREGGNPIAGEELFKFLDLESKIDSLHNEAHAIREVSRFISYIFINSRLKDSKSLQRDTNKTYDILGKLEDISPEKPLSWRHVKIMGAIFKKEITEITSIWNQFRSECEVV